MCAFMHPHGVLLLGYMGAAREAAREFATKVSGVLGVFVRLEGILYRGHIRAATDATREVATSIQGVLAALVVIEARFLKSQVRAAGNVAAKSFLAAGLQGRRQIEVHVLTV
eukprot:gnl/TRDRNA2_/TRDRNA2_136400_c1_seq3.p2 gnl/TRDRNA2_/TRDRNA2_136400_c1~~gnl/TRDRNA2_/TRDRNA2_136400_c1_seq3.p2  ORF type:complete len:112 (-),score=14.73 gnl/TRDRNA2_/TRDRNA2_136400_c1_seq3:377-712(-)